MPGYPTQAQVAEIAEGMNGIFSGCEFRVFTWDDEEYKIALNCGSMIDIVECMVEHHPDLVPEDLFVEPVNDEVMGVYFA